MSSLVSLLEPRSENGMIFLRLCVHWSCRCARDHDSFEARNVKRSRVREFRWDCRAARETDVTIAR
jgi:hypothetical protein